MTIRAPGHIEDVAAGRRGNGLGRAAEFNQHWRAILHGRNILRGILRLRCSGQSRFRLSGGAWQRDDGLWQSAAEAITDDALRTPGPAMQQTVNALAEAIRKLQQLDKVPFAEPYRLDDAGWVANRWCELLPVPLAAKQKLMELADPVIRLSIVDGYLRDKKVVLG